MFFYPKYLLDQLYFRRSGKQHIKQHTTSDPVFCDGNRCDDCGSNEQHVEGTGSKQQVGQIAGMPQ